MGVVVVMLAGGMLAGVFGSLLGLGGGILIVPLLSFVFGLPLREAVGVSLVCVIMTSSAAAGVYLERDVANLRLGMTLELFTATGALVGGAIAFLLDERVVAALFTLLLLYTAASMLRRGRRPSAAAPAAPDPPPSGHAGSLAGPGYAVRRLPLASGLAVFAGVMSALLGVGGGVINVPVMNVVMGVPIRVSTATSNLMIGVTASAGAITYLLRGGIDPFVAGPTAVGVFLGASLGSRTAHRVDPRLLRLLFVAVLLYTAVQMGRLALGI